MICPECGHLKHKGDCEVQPCPECDGRGKIEIETVTGGVNRNGPWQSYGIRLMECETCRGSGEVDE
ncbi:molecular chaperone DnaJ [uncultured Mediterranean phage uvDeep-CGR0-AD1-C123]|nr:molecular chaperone DnaJ [uncultured Mediterranean phage uvDeep-CGR0-AD1-C123]